MNENIQNESEVVQAEATFEKTSDEARENGGKDPLAVELGRRGGLARAKKLSKETRSKIARHAALSRFNKNPEQIEVKELEIVIGD